MTWKELDCDYNTIDVSDIVDIHEYLMKKNLILDNVKIY